MDRSVPDLHPAAIAASSSGTIGHTVVVFESVGSTNSAAAAMAGAGAAEGTVVAAAEQSAGRGRKGRSWYSSPTGSLVFSIILRPRRSGETLTSLLSVSAAAAIGEIWDDIDIKWPNDLWSGGRKLGGVLAEAKGDACIIGMGLDVNEESFPGPLEASAVSLRMLTGERLHRGRLLSRILEMFSSDYERWKAEGLAPFRETIERRLLWRGEEVALETGGSTIRGRLDGITEGGQIVLVEGGERRVFAAGDLAGPARGRRKE